MLFHLIQIKLALLMNVVGFVRGTIDKGTDVKIALPLDAIVIVHTLLICMIKFN